MVNQLFRKNEVLKLTGIGSSSSLYRLIAAGQFPAPIKLSHGGRSSAWVSDEVSRWIEERIEASRNNGEAL